MSTLGRIIVSATLVLAAASVASPQGKGGSSKDNRPLYYLSKQWYYGDQALMACDPGFHMASLWEIFDPSGLKYDTTRGYTQEDSTGGPPTWGRGWIRTANFANSNGSAGTSNCGNWTDVSLSARGSTARLNGSWSGTPTATGPWLATAELCSEAERVWCVQD